MNFPRVPEGVFKTLRVFAYLSAIAAGITTIVVVLLPKLHGPKLTFTYELGARIELFCQTVAIFLLLGFLRPLPSVSNSDSEISKAVGASQQFWRCWAFLWGSWLCLYVSWFAELYHPLPHYLADLFSMISNAALVLCYLVMAVRTWPPKTFAFRQIVFGVVTACVAVPLLEFFFARDSTELQEAFHWAQGLVSGVALALLVGRLDSKLTNTSRSTIVVLYAYAVLQFAYPGLYQKSSVLLVMTSAALFLKILLFWEVDRLFSSKTIFWYMYEYRRIYEEGPQQKVEFLKKLT